MGSGRYFWTGAGLVPGARREAAVMPAAESSEPAAEPLVIESWLVDGGRTRGLELHRRRFLDGCAWLLRDLETETLDAFWNVASATVPRGGRVWPRVEAYAAGASRLALWVRPAPEPRTETVLWVADTPDPRAYPRLKGPDLSALADLRAAAEANGADDALLLAPDGTVLETASAAVVWWDRDDLCVTADDLPVLPSVTRTLLIDRARARGVRVRQRRCDVADLDGLEVWTLNTLHGIRPVTAFRGTAFVGADGVAPALAVRAGEWHDALTRLQHPDTS